MKLAGLLQSKIAAKKNEQDAQFKAKREARRNTKLHEENVALLEIINK
jgi:hypothetical protein